MAKLTAIADYTPAAAKWGILRICPAPACEAQYYDKGAWPALCPVCGKRYEVHAVLSSGGRSERREEVASVVEAGDELLEEDSGAVGEDDLADADFDEPDTFSEET